MDSQESIGSDDTQEQPVLVDPIADDSSDDADASAPEPDVNLDALKANVEAATVRAELETLKRATGHIRGLQSKIDQLDRSVAKIQDLETSNQQLASRLDTLLDSLVDSNLVSERAAQGLRPQRGDNNRELLDRLDGLETRLTAAPTQREEDPEARSRMAAADVATAAVNKYARDKGFDPNQIPDAVWAGAYEKNNGDLSAASLDVMRYVEGELAKKNRRTERADAASGGTGERSARSGALTPAKLRSMTVDEVREFDIANPGVIDKVMAGK